MKKQHHSYPTFSTASEPDSQNRKTVYKLVCTYFPQIAMVRAYRNGNPDRHRHAHRLTDHD